MRVVEYESEGYKSSNFTVSGPWISAVVTIYRRSELAKKALQSVLCQSYPWIEVIAIEDGSCSDIGHWLQQSVFCNKVWRYMRAEQNQGLAVTRNYALKRAKGAYIAFLDDDDSWAENKIEKQMQVMHKMPNIDAVVSGAIFFDRYGASERLYTISGPVRDMLAMHSTRVFPDNTALYRVDTLRTICGFDEQLRSHTEYGLWMRLAAINAIVYCLHDTLVSINQYHIDQMTTDYEIRMQVTDVAVMQWRSQWVSWFGADKAAWIAKEFVSRSYLALGENLATYGAYVPAIRCLFEPLKRYPYDLNILFCVAKATLRSGLRMIRIYKLCRTLWRNLRINRYA